MKKLLLLVLFAGSLSVILNSCKKETVDTETESAVDNSICEGEFHRVMPTVHSVAITEERVRRGGNPVGIFPATGCPNTYIAPEDTTFPISLIFDYGAGCVDSVDGKMRKGKLIATFSGPWDSVGCQVTIQLVDYFVGNIHFEGTVTIDRNSLYSYTTKVANGKCSNPNWTLSWETTRTISQTGGTNTPFDKNDDVFEGTGNSSGVNRKGVPYKVNIVQNLVKRHNCSWIESGKVELTPEGLSTRTVDFGNGTCDNKATLTINGNSYDFTLN